MVCSLQENGTKIVLLPQRKRFGNDFVLRYKGECVIVKCKAKSGNAKSLQTILKHSEKYHVYHAIKLGDYNVGRTGALLTLPFSFNRPIKLSFSPCITEKPMKK